MDQLSSTIPHLRERRMGVYLPNGPTFLPGRHGFPRTIHHHRSPNIRQIWRPRNLNPENTPTPTPPIQLPEETNHTQGTMLESSTVGRIELWSTNTSAGLIVNFDPTGPPSQMAYPRENIPQIYHSLWIREFPEENCSSVSRGLYNHLPPRGESHMQVQESSSRVQEEYHTLSSTRQLQLLNRGSTKNCSNKTLASGSSGDKSSCSSEGHQFVHSSFSS